MDLHNVLEKLRELNSNIPHISQGGCGVFAVTLYEQLIKLNSSFDVELILFTNSDEFSVNEAIYKASTELDGDFTLDDINRHCVFFDHIIVKYGPYFIDNSGVYDSLDLLLRFWSWPNYMTIGYSIIKQISEYCDGWNDRFNRDYIPRLIDEIEDLADYLI